MIDSVILPNSRNTSGFNEVIVYGTPGEKVLFSLLLYPDQKVILDKEIYFFSADGSFSIRSLGKVMENYFIEPGISVVDSEKTFLLKFAYGDNFNMSHAIELHIRYCRAKASIDFTSFPLSRISESMTYSNTPEYISFISKKDATAILTATYINNNQVQSSDFTLQTFSDDNKIYFFDVSSDVVLNMIQKKGIYIPYSQLMSWEVKMSNVVKKYTFNPISLPSPTTFLFRNAFLALETFTFKGLSTKEFNTEREFGVINDYTVVTSRNEKKEYTVNSGHLNADQEDTLIDLVTSDVVYVRSGMEWLPVIIVGEDIKSSPERNIIHSFEITYRFTDNNNLTAITGNVRSFDESFDESFM